MNITGMSMLELSDNQFPFVKWNDSNGFINLCGLDGSYGGKDTVNTEIPIVYGAWNTEDARFQIPIFAFSPQIIPMNALGRGPYSNPSTNYVNLCLGHGITGLKPYIPAPIRVFRSCNGKSSSARKRKGTDAWGNQYNGGSGGSGGDSGNTPASKAANLIVIPPNAMQPALYNSYFAFLGDNLHGFPTADEYPIYDKGDSFFAEFAIGVETTTGNAQSVINDAMWRAGLSQFVGASITGPSLSDYQVRGYLSGDKKDRIISGLCATICQETGMIFYVDPLGMAQVMPNVIYSAKETTVLTETPITTPSSTDPHTLSPLCADPKKYQLTTNPPKWGTPQIWLKYCYSPRKNDYLNYYSPYGIAPPTDTTEYQLIVESKWLYLLCDAIDYWGRCQFVMNGNARLLEVDTSHKQLGVTLGDIVEWSGDDILKCRQMIIACDHDLVKYASKLRGIEVIQIPGVTWGPDTNQGTWDNSGSQWGMGYDDSLP